MKELERVKEFMDTLEFHGYIDHDPTKLNQLIEDYYPLKQGQTLPLDGVRLCLSCKKREGHFTKRFNTTLCDGCYDKTLNEV